MRKIKTVEELYHLLAQGTKVTSPKVNYLMAPKPVEKILGLSVRSLLDIIDKGLYAVGVEEIAPERGLLEWAKQKIRETGLSHGEIASLMGLQRSTVTKFMNSASVQTRVVDRYFEVLGLNE